MKQLNSEFVEKWYDTIENSEEFLDFSEHIDINSFKEIDGVRCVLFENGNNYTVDTIMKETDGDKEREIIDRLSECGVEFRGEL